MKCIKELCSKHFSQQQFNHIQKLAGMQYHCKLAYGESHAHASIIGRILYEALGLKRFHKMKTVFSIMVAAIESYIKQVCIASM